MTLAFLGLLAIPLALGTALSMRARAHRPPDDASRRDQMFRTAFGFAAVPAAASAEIGDSPIRRHSPSVFVLSVVPFAASGILAAFAAPHQVKQLWIFSCRLFGH